MREGSQLANDVVSVGPRNRSRTLTRVNYVVIQIRMAIVWLGGSYDGRCSETDFARCKHGRLKQESALSLRLPAGV